MSPRVISSPPLVNISTAERDTGLSKDTLRVWERRYGFPDPARDVSGERLYTAAQIERLRLLKRLVDAGERPGRLMNLTSAELDERLNRHAAQAFAGEPRGVDECLEILKSHDLEELRRHLTHAREQLGLARFVTDVVAPLNTRVGDAWMRGELQVFEEHLYTEAIQVVLREAIASAPALKARGAPRVLLTTFPQEPHGLGLLMAQALLSLDGATCVSLGVCTPLWDIVLASAAQRIDVVALSFSGCMNPNQVVDGLTELRAKLPAAVEVWAGGAAPALHRRPVAGVRAIAAIGQIHDEVRRWSSRLSGR